MIITISGTPGSGKSTVAKLLAAQLKAERLYVGGTMRDLAKQRGISIQELNRYALLDPKIDVEIDKQTAEQARSLAAARKIVLVEGRTQFHFLPESVKLYLKVSLEEAARRVWKDLQQESSKQERNEGNLGSIAEVKKELQEREENDAKRYKKYYGFDHRQENHYDLVIDTTTLSPQKVVEEILAFLAKKNTQNSRNSEIKREIQSKTAKRLINKSAKSD